MRGKTTVQAEGDEQRLSHCVPVWEPPFILPHLGDSMLKGLDFSKNSHLLFCSYSTLHEFVGRAIMPAAGFPAGWTR